MSIWPWITRHLRNDRKLRETKISKQGKTNLKGNRYFLKKEKIYKKYLYCTQSQATSASIKQEQDAVRKEKEHEWIFGNFLNLLSKWKEVEIEELKNKSSIFSQKEEQERTRKRGRENEIEGENK